MKRGVALLLAWDLEVLDIQEQFPLLPVSRTQELAAERGIVHPTKDGYPLTRTFDFRFRSAVPAWSAISVKPADKISPNIDDGPRTAKRTEDLLELERAFAEAERWPWALVTEEEIPRTRAKNLSVLNQQWRIQLSGIDAAREAEIADAVTRRLQRGHSLAEACERSDIWLRLPEKGISLSVSWNRLARQLWCVDLDLPFDPRTMHPRPGPPTAAHWRSQLTFL